MFLSVSFLSLSINCSLSKYLYISLLLILYLSFSFLSLSKTNTLTCTCTYKLMQAHTLTWTHYHHTLPPCRVFNNSVLKVWFGQLVYFLFNVKNATYPQPAGWPPVFLLIWASLPWQRAGQARSTVGEPEFVPGLDLLFTTRVHVPQSDILTLSQSNFLHYLPSNDIFHFHFSFRFQVRRLVRSNNIISLDTKLISIDWN